ncbi:hypothetical protein BD410DRAFT_809649 [Rickenella mellea]|uniref:Uncharacterized protein n=1 Tax=Rickenella mellea TaxID=50990 RepID=A0A4Y7PJ20_9AGAM|nr:hypothetical protein BD410DRAFT_809649 [Rickenella mellea]
MVTSSSSYRAVNHDHVNVSANRIPLEDPYPFNSIGNNVESVKPFMVTALSTDFSGLSILIFKSLPARRHSESQTLLRLNKTLQSRLVVLVIIAIRHIWTTTAYWVQIMPRTGDEFMKTSSPIVRKCPYTRTAASSHRTKASTTFVAVHDRLTSIVTFGKPLSISIISDSVR